MITEKVVSVQIVNNLNQVIENNQLISTMLNANQKFLQDFLDTVLVKGSQITINDDAFDLQYQEAINTRSMSFVEEGDIETGFKNYDYILRNPESEFFITDKHIMEVSFKDTLAVTKKIELKSFVANQYVIEVTFKSERVKLRSEKVIKNKFRFVHSIASGKTTCRRLNE